MAEKINVSSAINERGSVGRNTAGERIAAELEAILPPHVGGFHLTRNECHGYYQSVGQMIEEQTSQNCEPDWTSDEQREKAIAANSYWQVQWYPDTPIGCYVVCACDLSAIIDYLAAEKIGISPAVTPAKDAG